MKSNRGRYRPSQENDRYVRATTKGTWQVRDGRLTFGKHKGSLLKDVIENDVEYMAWAIENIDGFSSNLTDRMLRECRRSASRKGSGSKRHKKRSKAARQPSGLVREVLERMEAGMSPHTPNPPTNPPDDHLDPTFVSEFGNQFDDVDDAPPW